VTPWQTHLFKQEGAAAGKQADMYELERMWNTPSSFCIGFAAQRAEETRERAEKEAPRTKRAWVLQPRIAGARFPAKPAHTWHTAVA
jgi:hypothetical protein